MWVLSIVTRISIDVDSISELQFFHRRRFEPGCSLGFDSDGNMMMRLGDNMALEVDSGELHIVSSWENEE